MENSLGNMSGTWELFDLPSPPTGKKKRKKKGRPKDHAKVRIRFRAS